MTTLPLVELGVLGPLQVRKDGSPVAVPGAKPRAILTMLGLHGGSVVSADALVELLWGDDPPRTAGKALQTHISSLRRTLVDRVVVTEGAGWTLTEAEVDVARYKLAARMGREAAAAGDTSQAVARFEAALALWRGTPELPDSHRGASEKTRWIEGHAALVEDRADALLATGRAAEIIGELEAAVADAPLRERRWAQLMLALYRAGRQGEALGAYQRARSLLADQLGVDPGSDLRRLEAAIVAQDVALDMPVAQHASAVMRAVTFLLTDIEGSTAAWEAETDAMAVALARHDELVEQAVTSRGGRLIKTRGEGDATFSVFDRPSSAAAAAVELQEAISHEPWTLSVPMRIRVALHTGEVELRDGDYFGRAVNRAARLRSLASGGQILCSGATAELVIDSLPDDVALADLGMRQLRNLARPEHVFELRLDATDDRPHGVPTEEPLERPELPAVLTGPGPFVGRGRELARLVSAWQVALAGGMGAVLIAGEPGVGKTRLAGEWSRQAYEQEAIVFYGRCDEDLGAPYQPFAEALRSLVPCLGESRLRGLRGVEALLPLIPGLTDVLPDLAPPTRADPDTERYALFDAVVALLDVASASAPVVLVLDDLHWAAKPTLLLLRHLLRFGERARVQIIGTYRSTDLDRSHPLAAMLADLHRDGTAERLQLSGLDEDDVTTYVAESGYDDEELARALASVTGGNPFFLIEALRHVDESGGVWDQSTLPQGVREAVSRRLSRLPVETNKALAAAAVVGSRFAVELVERVVGDDLVDAFDEACKAGIVVEEPGGHYRFNHALVRQSLLAELPSVRRMRLHQRIATTLESEPGAEDDLLADLAHHYFECAWAGNAAKAVEYCRRAADQAMAGLAYEGAADLYDHALHALEEIDDELPDRDDQKAELLVARCEALLAAGDMASASDAVAQLQSATRDSARLAAWATCFDGQLSMLIHPERLDDVEAAVGAAAGRLAELGDAAGEAKAHTVRAGCLARLGRIGDSEIALDHALTAARRGREHRRVNAVLAGAPLAALWGPNPVPRAGGRCLDVVRLLRITTDSPAVEATSTRCQAVLEAFRGRGAAARRMIDSARRTVTELGLRHALLEVEQFAGIVELVVDDPAAAEPHLRKAYNGFRRMGLDADTAETAALLGRTCLALDRDGEADELCTESERLAGHALKASIAWRTLRAQLLSRRGDHDQAKRLAEAAVSLAERTDALVDHGDACLTLAEVLGAAGDTTGARAAAEQAIALYERKGAGALAERARRLLSERAVPASPTAPEASTAKLDNECVRVGHQMLAAFDRGAWGEAEKMYAPNVFVESRRKIVGFTQADVPSGDWPRVARHLREGWAWFRLAVIAVRGERLALTRFELGTDDASPGAPHEEMLGLWGLDEDGRMALQVFFDVDDIDAAIAELDAAHARFEEAQPRRALENEASRVLDRFIAFYADSRWDEIGASFADNFRGDDRRRGLHRETSGRTTAIAEVRAIADLGVGRITSTPLALRGANLCLSHEQFEGRDPKPGAFVAESLTITEVDSEANVVSRIAFDLDDLDAAFKELDNRFLAGEAQAYAHTWSLIAKTFTALNSHDLDGVPATNADYHIVDHRLLHATIQAADVMALFRATYDLTPDLYMYIEAVHRLDDVGAVITQNAYGTSQEGFDAQWRMVQLLTVEGDLGKECELFDEADLDVALARFEELHPQERRLENAATRTYDRYRVRFKARDWDAVAEMLAEDHYTDDRRHVIGAGTSHGRDAEIAGIRATADLGVTSLTSEAIAIRGHRLVLCRVRGATGGADAFANEVLRIVEIDADDRILTRIAFDVGDIDAAFEELDARYLAGEAAAYAHTWSVMVDAFAALNRHEFPVAAPDYVIVDHRLHHTTSGAGGLTEYLSASWDLTPDFHIYIEAVHRLSDLGVVLTLVVHGTSHEGLEADWRLIELLTAEGDVGNRCEIFDEADLEAALARFDELSTPTRQLESAATQVNERYRECYMARDWDALAKTLAPDFLIDDRRRAVNAGIEHGRDAVIENLRATADLGNTNVTSTVVATRGGRLILTSAGYSGSDEGLEAFRTEVLSVVEVNAADRLAATVVFDRGDIGAAFAELDARYLAGEAADHAHTWSVITKAYATLNRGEMPLTTADLVNLDHRRLATISSGDLLAHLRATWDLTAEYSIYIRTVHQLTDLGAVVTNASYGTSQDGLAAEWRETEIVTVEGDRLNRCEMFDETDIDAALARFEELHPRAHRLENAASQAYERTQAHIAAGDWAAMAEILADDFRADDRRPVVGAGVRDGRDALIADLRVTADLAIVNVTSTVVATRGDHIALVRGRYMRPDHGSDAYLADVLNILEMNADDQIAAAVVFASDELDAALAELDARYLAGEATAYAHTWSVLTQVYAALNRREMPRTAPDWVDIDHRPLASIGSGDLIAYLHTATRDLANFSVYAESVHRLTGLGAVVTHVAIGTSQEGFDAEWRMVAVMTRDGNLINGCEIFDETELDTALARFDELAAPPRQLESPATHAYDRYRECYVARDWNALAQTMAPDFLIDDRRRPVNSGITQGRDSAIEIMKATADLGNTNVTSTVLATRGKRLILTNAGFSDIDQGQEAFRTDVLSVSEMYTDNRLSALVLFDREDIDAAFAELDARYLAGEAAAHADTWSVIADAYATLNRRELPATTQDWVNVDHRRFATIEAGELTANIRASWDLTPDSRQRIEAVHRLSNFGAVVTHVAYGTSQEGFDAEWREIELDTVEGDLISGCEKFDEADLEAALARFDELHTQKLRPENAATRVIGRFQMCFAARDWDAMAGILAEDISAEDRRPVMGAGTRAGKDINIADWRSVAEVGFAKITSTVIATRGERLALGRFLVSTGDEQPDSFHNDVLGVCEIDSDNRIVDSIMFDPDDIAAAFAELDARYSEGEALACADTWSVVASAYVTLNSRQLPATTPNCAGIDHRRGIAFEGDMIPYVNAWWDVAADITMRIEAVHRLTSLGAVVTWASYGTSQKGFNAEWRGLNILTVKGDLIDRGEIFDEADIDAALARFEELNRG